MYARARLCMHVNEFVYEYSFFVLDISINLNNTKEVGSLYFRNNVYHSLTQLLQNITLIVKCYNKVIWIYCRNKRENVKKK